MRQHDKGVFQKSERHACFLEELDGDCILDTVRAADMIGEVKLNISQCSLLRSYVTVEVLQKYELHACSFD